MPIDGPRRTDDGEPMTHSPPTPPPTTNPSADQPAARNVRSLSPNAVREAIQRMAEIRIQVQNRNGVLDLAVPLIRELRDSGCR